MNQDNSITLYWENLEYGAKIDHFSDILDVYTGLNEHIDMIPSKSCEASSDTSLEPQNGVVWFQMAQKALKEWANCSIFKNARVVLIFSSIATLCPLLFVCLSSVFDMKYLSLFEYQEYSKREQFHIKNR